MRSLWVLVATAIWWQVVDVARCEAPQEPTAESLVAVTTRLEKDLWSTDPHQRTATLESMFPNRKDLAILFAPQHDNKLQMFTEILQAKLKKKLADLSGKELAQLRQRRGELVAVEVQNVREKDMGGRYAAVLEMIPADVPVYRADTKYEKIVGGPSTYIFVNGRWIYLIGFDSIPEILPKLDRLIEKAKIDES